MRRDLIDLKAHGPVLAAYTVLSLARLGQTLDVTEAIYLTRSQIPLGQLFLFPYSPVYLFLLHLWNDLGESVLWLRLLGLLIGLVALILTPRVLRGLGGAHAEGGAMWLLAASPFFVEQMRSVTPSALAFLAVVVALLCLLEFLRAGGSGWLVGWVASMSAALLVHGGLYYLAIAVGLGMLYYRRRYDSRQLAWWLAQVPPLVLFAVLFGAQLNRFVLHRAAETNTASAAGAQWLALGADLPAPWSWVAAGLLGLLLLSGLWACVDFRRDPRHGLLMLGFGLPVAIWLVWLPHDFYAVAALPCLAVLASMGLRLYPRWARQTLWGAVALTYGWSHWLAAF
ncbi:MAG: glycosyltransferase family 39 protein [Gemmatimonadota bacterium]